MNAFVKRAEEREDIPADLRKHFDSDVTKIKNATNLIFTIFINQMENMSAEQNNWKHPFERK